MKGYKTSKDYGRLKELLDAGHQVVIVWQHSTTLRLFSGIAEKHVSRDALNYTTVGYHLDAWSWFPQSSRESFEDKCKAIGFEYIVPEEADKA